MNLADLLGLKTLFARIAIEEANVVLIAIPFTSFFLTRKVQILISDAMEFHTVPQRTRFTTDCDDMCGSWGQSPILDALRIIFVCFDKRAWLQIIERSSKTSITWMLDFLNYFSIVCLPKFVGILLDCCCLFFVLHCSQRVSRGVENCVGFSPLSVWKVALTFLFSCWCSLSVPMQPGLVNQTNFEKRFIKHHGDHLVWPSSLEWKPLCLLSPSQRLSQALPEQLQPWGLACAYGPHLQQVPASVRKRSVLFTRWLSLQPEELCMMV